MSTTLQRERTERASMPPVRELADQAFSRTAGAPLVEGNSVRLLIDARENYPAWLDAISTAEHHINFESYIIHEDSAGWRFADALVAKARDGVRVRLIYDWMGGFGRLRGRSGITCAREASKFAVTTRHASIHRWAGSRATIARCFQWMNR